MSVFLAELWLLLAEILLKSYSYMIIIHYTCSILLNLVTVVEMREKRQWSNEHKNDY